MLCTRRETLGQWLAPAPLSSSQLGSFANQFHLCIVTNWQVTWMDGSEKQMPEQVDFAFRPVA
jgi:hypothetical protein